MIVALDGPAGVGKSSIAARIAGEWDFFNLNSGNFYRAVALKSIRQELSPENETGVIKTAESCEIEIRNFRFFLDGQDVEDKLHTDEIDGIVAQISAIVPVRHIVNEKIREISKNMDIVAEGRDMTTVVFPDAEIKIFLDASPEVRARRRLDQGVSRLTFEEILESIRKRDIIDRNKKEGSLIISDDAIYLETSFLTLDEVCAKVSDKIKELQ